MPLTYNPHIFDVATIDDAMRIILTPEGVPTEQRWAVETPYFAELIARSFPLTSDSILLDFGCGIGRLAKELILRHQCRVVGVDISPSMRALAEIYVDSDRFFSCPPAMLETLIDRGLRFDLALAIWVLQHSWQPQDDIDLIAEAIAPSGGLFVVNQKTRAVPTVEAGWANDGIDVSALLGEQFRRDAGAPLPPNKAGEILARQASWAAWRPIRR